MLGAFFVTDDVCEITSQSDLNPNTFTEDVPNHDVKVVELTVNVM